jgi:hypothetical protein
MYYYLWDFHRVSSKHSILQAKKLHDQNTLEYAYLRS